MQEIWSLFLSGDRALLYQINTVWIAPWLDFFMALVSDPHAFLWPMVIGVLGLAIFGKFRARLFLVLMILALLLGDAGVGNTIKHAVHRPRPYQALEGIRIVTRDGVRFSTPAPTTQGRSFTSGHACNNVSLAIMAVAVFGRGCWPLWLWAALVSYSRIYNGAHYPGDILGSWLIAALYCRAILGMTQGLWRKFAPSFCPQLYAAHPQLFSRKPHV